MKIAIVILNWNGRELLEKFLPSVIAHSANATIYVADNASVDDSVKFVSETYPTVQIIVNKQNGGYAKGYNEALHNVSEDIFVLLNSDVEVTENWLDPIIDRFGSDSTMVAAQPKILDYKRKNYFEYAGAAGGYIDKYGYPYCRGRIFDTLEIDNGQYDNDVEIFWASGACLFVRSQSFWEVGGFDEDYFAHQEEIDLCWRMQNAGGKIRYIGQSKVYHVGGATLSATSPQKTFFNFRNSLLNIYKNVSGPRVYWTIFVRFILDGIAGFLFLIKGQPQHFAAIIRAHFSFYSMLPTFHKKRKIFGSRNLYFMIKSIVYQYFIAGKKKFNELS